MATDGAGVVVGGRGPGHRPRRWARRLWWLMAAGLVARGAYLRWRALGLPRLADEAPPPSGEQRGGWGWLMGAGSEVDAGLRARVEAHAEAAGLDVVDLVPPGLPLDDALDVVRDLPLDEPYRTARLAPGITAGRALAARQPALERAGVAPGRGADTTTLRAAAVELKRCCPTSTDLVVDLPATGLAPSGDPGAEGVGRRTPVGPGLRLAGLGVLAAGVVVAPGPGAVALACWCLQPLVALAGTPVQPADLWRESLLRWWRGPRRAVAEAVAAMGAGPAADEACVARRAAYAAELAAGVDRFFEERRATCPLCGSAELSARLATGDLVVHKPGAFTLDRCGGCGHIFQNPRLTVEGLDFYYRDVYDGLGGEGSDLLFDLTKGAYRARAAMLPEEAAPRRWLDVGTGYGHFPLVARERWPDTAFDGLDVSECVVEGERRGWIAHGYRGLLDEWADRLTGRYDVVSMFHALEHTRDPVAELEVAAAILPPGGHLLLELPDPESPYARLVGRYWFPWLQPQHQHFLTRSRVRDLLEAKGFEVVASGPVEAFPAVDLAAAVLLAVNRLAPEPGLPWRPEPTVATAVRRQLLLAVGLPVAAVAAVVDQAAAVAVPRLRGASAFRVVARRC